MKGMILMYGYIYRTYNKVNGKMYIGQKKSPVFLGKKYLGSGKILNLAVRKYGRDNFDIELLEECNSEEELNIREIYWISYYNAVDSYMYYNICKGGQPIGSLKGVNNPMYGKHHSEETKKLLSEKNRGYKHTDEARKKMSLARSGKHLSEQHKLNISKGSKGKKLTAEHKRKISENHADISGSNHPMYGKHFSEEIRKRMSDGLKLYYKSNPGISCGINNSMYGKHHSEETKKLISEKTKGTNNPMYGKRGDNNPNYGKKFINNGIINKMVKSSELDSYINDGWMLGKLLKGDNK